METITATTALVFFVRLCVCVKTLAVDYEMFVEFFIGHSGVIFQMLIWVVVSFSFYCFTWFCGFEVCSFMLVSFGSIKLTNV